MATKRKEPSRSSSRGKNSSERASSSSKKTKRQQVKVKPVKASEESDFAEEPELVLAESDFENGDDVDGSGDSSSIPPPTHRKPKRRGGKKNEEEVHFRFLGKPIPEKEARRRWPYRFEIKAKGKLKEKGGSKNSNGEEDSEELIEARCHFDQAQVDGHIFNLGDDAYVQAEDGKDYYICKIVEMFQAVNGMSHFRAQWFYRARDTVITEHHEKFIDEKQVFFSEIRDDNFLDCLVKPLVIARFPPNVGLEHREKAKLRSDYYYDMMYLLPHCTFMILEPDDTEGAGSESDSTISTEADVDAAVVSGVDVFEEEPNLEMKLLDLYSGCGAMSTGLCLGANSAGVKLVTKWALDLNQYACESLRWNHPEAEVVNESADNYLCLLQEWQKLCASFSLVAGNIPQHSFLNPASKEVDEVAQDEGDDEDDDDKSEVFEVEKVLDICYGDPKENKTVGLHFKIRWKGYGPDDDTWEPIEGLSHCQEKVKDFVTKGYKRKILPLPGIVDVICGGPPCQGISGFNRFRNPEEPLKDEKNRQLEVFMDIVAFLKPRFVLMENVGDLFKFARGYLGRYAFARLIQMNYQARLGMMAAGAYGLAQFRMRAFMWGALPTEKLPQYPLPTHDVVVRGNAPREFESSIVAYEEGCKVSLEKKLLLDDVISDLPSVGNDEPRDEMMYTKEPKSEFQQFIRLRRSEMPGCLAFGSEASPHKLYDHRPLRLNIDDYSRVCRVPKKKGANFRDLPGVKVGPDNKVFWDADVERVLLPSGKPLVPEYAMSFVRGTSPKPFGRLWWDETVPTVVTRAEPHNQVILHPQQDRVLTIRENARLQGFPDYYKLFGPIKERYIQVGNAVAVPVARALGHSLSLALKSLSGKEPVFILPKNFPHSVETTHPELSS